MHLGIFELVKSVHCRGGILVVYCRNSEGDKHLVGVKSRVAAAEILGLEHLNRRYYLG